MIDEAEMGIILFCSYKHVFLIDKNIKFYKTPLKMEDFIKISIN